MCINWKVDIYETKSNIYHQYISTDERMKESRLHQPFKKKFIQNRTKHIRSSPRLFPSSLRVTSNDSRNFGKQNLGKVMKWGTRSSKNRNALNLNDSDWFWSPFHYFSEIPFFEVSTVMRRHPQISLPWSKRVLCGLSPSISWSFMVAPEKEKERKTVTQW